MNPEISIVVPLFNEEKNLPKLVEEVKGVLLSLSVSFEIVLVDDGSRDASFEIVKELANLNQEVQGISLSRNFGHQTALLAGLEHSRGNLVITMDADLQHPPSLIPQLIEKQKEGYDIVNTKCNSVEGAGFLKTFSSGLYYKIVNLLSDVHIEPGSADFRLMTRRVVDHFTSIPERDRFTRGLVRWMGFRQALVEYDGQARYSGKTKYTLRKMIRLGLNGVTSFSSKPLRMAVHAGLLVFIFGLIYAGYAIVRFFMDKTVPGWTSILVSILLIGGFQLLSIGIIGEYIARIYNEAKGRPHYFIKDEVNNNS